MNYLNHIMADGSRLFAELPDIPMAAFKAHLLQFEGIELGEETTDGVTEWWLDFTYKGQTFSAHDTVSELRVFANDGECPASLLTELMGYFWLLQSY